MSHAPAGSARRALEDAVARANAAILRGEATGTAIASWVVMSLRSRSLIVLVGALPVLLASSLALAAPGKTAKAPKKKPKVTAPSPAKEEAAPEPTAPPTAPTAARVEPVPVPVATSSAKPAEDRPTAAPSEADDRAGNGISVAPLLGFGTNHLNFGVGARAGYTLPQKVYIGATFLFHFGTSESVPGFGDVSSKVFYPAAEVGYDFHVGPVTVRPYGGIGVVWISTSGTFAGQSRSSSDNSLAFYPGATAHFNVPQSSFFVGADTRLLILTRGGDPSFGLFATGGLKF
jgi:Outer membrane protein beta-barrel domain